ncbi:MAG: CdaR family protein [Eubacteriales bacterium]|nr:CdaR family protein [Eubacteriales bacterium]
MKNWMTKHDVLTKVLSIIAAVILWSYFMSVQNPTRTLEYRDISVQLTGVDELNNSYNLKVVDGADTTVNVKVSAQTSRLATLTASQIKVQANVSDTITAAGTYEIAYNVILPESGMTCVSKSPDTITVTVDEVETKTVPVSVEMSDEAPDGYLFGTPELSADSVEISGPATILEQVSNAVVNVDTAGVKETVSNNYSYKLVDSKGNAVDTTNISRSIASVTVTIPVQQVKSVPLEVTISPENATDSITTSISPQTVEIVGDPSAIRSVDSIHLGAINATSAQNGDTHEFDISLPTGVALTDGQPTTATVTVTIDEDTTKEYTIDEINLEDINQDETATVSVETTSLTVTLIGKEKLLDSIDASDITAVAQLSSSDLSDGQHTIGVTISSPDGTTVSGNYSVTITISRDS